MRVQRPASEHPVFSTGSAAIATTVVRRGPNHESGPLKHTGCFPRRKIEMKKLMFVLIASAVCSAFTINASAQQADQATTDAIIAMTKAQWASEIKDPTNVAERSEARRVRKECR